MNLSLDQPLWLALMALAIPLAIVAICTFGAMTRFRLVTAILLRTALLGVAALMLAGAASVREVNRVAVVAVVDVSRSAVTFGAFGDSGPSAMAAAFMREASLDRGPDDLIGVVAFDGVPRVVAAPSASPVLDRPIEPTGVEGSAIGAALERAASLIPDDARGRIVLFSDGAATDGAVMEAVARLANGRTATPIDVVPYAFTSAREVVVESLEAPGFATPGSVITLRVTTRATAPTAGRLTVTREGEPIDINGSEAGDARLVEAPVGRTVFLVDVPATDDRLQRFEAVFEPIEPTADRVATNNRAEAFTIAPGPGRVLLVNGGAQDLATADNARLARLLREGGVEVDVEPPATMPDSLVDLQAYDLVILADVAADEVSDLAMLHIEAFTKELGGGLLFVGGPNAFGAGGWRGSRLEPLFPVLLDLPERLVVPEAAIIFVLDSSGSMSQSVLGSSRSQQDIANESAARAVASLDETDLVGVISFNNDASVVRSLGSNTDPRATADRIRGIQSGGGTNIAPALRAAKAQLETADAKVKHVIVLSDGASIEPEQLPGLAAELRDAGIAVSTIGVGDAADTKTLTAMAQEGDGVFYSVVNPRVLPKVFLKAVRVVRSPMVREQPFEPVVVPTGSPLTADLGAPPTLGGLTLTQARSEPSVTNAMLAPTGEPVLAHWRFGLGQVAAFTSNAEAWARDWRGWGGERAFWTRTARTLARASSSTGRDFRVDRSADGIELRYEAFDADGTPIERASVPVALYGPDGDRRDVRLRQTAPGIYTASVEATSSGNHIAIASPTLNGSPLGASLAGTTIAANAEQRRLEPDLALLERIAEASGGRMLDPLGADTADLFNRDGIAPRVARRPLWPILIVWLLALTIADIATRRIAWDRLLVATPALAATGAAIDATSRLATARSGTRAKATSQPVQTLSDRDARQAIKAAETRRVKAEADRLRAMRESQNKGGARDANSPPANDGGGLLEAKRRAKRRFDNDEQR